MGGEAVRIKQLQPEPEVAHRPREIGFGEEQLIRPLTAQANVICQVSNTRLALSTLLSAQILLEPVEERIRVCVTPSSTGP